VAAISATSAWAVGSSGGLARPRTLLLRWNGTQWSLLPTPPPPGGGILHGVAVVSAASAWAVGSARGWRPGRVSLPWAWIPVRLAGPLPITASRMGCLLDALEHAYRLLGIDQVADGDEVFGDLVTARIIEPLSKLDNLRVLDEAGVVAASYRTVKRRLPAYAKDARLPARCTRA